ncbi:MAG: radical SAM protein [Clostridia bacterium]|nr:radical SAM protein [Clostridia bacterium]
MSKVFSKTESLCPTCFKKIDATIVVRGQSYIMKKTCPTHGDFETTVWKGSIPMENWKLTKERANIKKPLTQVQNGCPYDCGLCPQHRQHTCTALIEITQRCNLNCRFCFADAKNGGKEPSLEEIGALYKGVLDASGACNIQLSGGEPTLRDDLPQIIKLGKDLGFGFIQVNTNGIRLAQEEGFAEKLKLSGLDSIYLQFDGTDDLIYYELRGAKLLDLKIKAIENCEKVGIGVVLVPTLVPGVNIGNIGEIIEFALRHINAVSGVHFQPVSYFGRVPHPPRDEDRITLPELMDEIEKQTKGKIKADSLRPPQCENSFCSFHGRYLLQGNGELSALRTAPDCCSKKAEECSKKAKIYVAKNWAARRQAAQSETATADSWDKIINIIKSSTFNLSAMAFQDVWNLDLARVMDCCIHVVSPEGKLIPFCLYNITDAQGHALYRK